MKPADLIKYFGSQSAAARALGVSRAVVWQWCDRDSVPRARQYEIAELTAGKLKVAKRKA